MSENTTPEYGTLVEVCGRYGIPRSRAFELQKQGLLDTFQIGRRRMVYTESVRTLPQRLAKPSGQQ